MFAAERHSASHTAAVQHSRAVLAKAKADGAKVDAPGVCEVTLYLGGFLRAAELFIFVFSLHHPCL